MRTWEIWIDEGTYGCTLQGQEDGMWAVVYDGGGAEYFPDRDQAVAHLEGKGFSYHDTWAEGEDDAEIEQQMDDEWGGGAWGED